MWYDSFLRVLFNFQTVLQPILNPKVRGTGVEEAKVVSIEPDADCIEAAKPIDDPELWKMIWTVNTKNPIGVIIVGNWSLTGKISSAYSDNGQGV